MPPTNPTEFQLRPATAADNVLLAELGAQTFASAFGADNNPEDLAAYLAATFSPAKQAAELADHSSQYLIVEHSGEPVGFARLKTGPAPAVVGAQRPVEIAKFYATEAWRGRGVGAVLMPACLRAAEAGGHDMVWLTTWDRNARGIAFYERWGFAVVGQTVFQVGSDPQTDVVLARAVRAP